MSLSHTSLQNYYSENFEMMHRFQYSLTELDEMLPWEREIYRALMIEKLRKEAKEADDLKNEFNSNRRR